ncbi:hypothetical protein [Nitrospirillum iridis]|uniref:Uncharacterized protein n=1 Tax=Nitrospirillum iridis TaxID=765888 RepID=A0A7X0B3X6_9PROT|nr:hypothetical protein [Nitrospirillum iridis]MBB6255218.1 hypothetical protein [Nitrospirillum iridis]
MADFELTIYVEGFTAPVGAPPGGNEQWLGRTLTVALTGKPRDVLGSEDKALLLALLCPWRWAVIHWHLPGNPVPSPVPNGPTGELEAYLKQLLAGDLDSLAFRVNFDVPDEDKPDDAEEDQPIWPGLLAQLSRLGPQVSHPLRLAHLAKVIASPQPDIGIEKIVIDGKDYPIDAEVEVPSGAGSRTVKVRCRAEPAEVLPAGKKTGLIDHDTRLVTQDMADFCTPQWLAELPSRLGRAIDPLPRLADLAEACDGLPTIGGKSVPPKLEAMLIDLFGGPGYDKDGVAEILLAIANLDPTATVDKKQAFAQAWSGAFGSRRDQLAKSLAGDLASAVAPGTGMVDAAVLREHYGAAAFVALIRDTLRASVPTSPDTLQQTAKNWLEGRGNVETVYRALLPEALARRSFLPELVRQVGGEPADWEPLREKFTSLFRARLERWQLKAPEKVIKATKDRVFHIKPEGVDGAARDGLPFRVDTIFHNPAGALDIHRILDGYLVAVSDRSIRDTRNPYELVTQGSFDIVHTGATTPPPLSQNAVLGVHEPLPVVFEVGQPGGEHTETRLAAASYRGLAMIPWSARQVPQDQRRFVAETATVMSIQFLHAPDGTMCPPLAYGQDYRIVCGYQAPGGLLPSHFATPSDPLRFAPQELENLDTQFVREVSLRRTLIPGPPRFLADGQANAGPATFAMSVEATVRPLWREHMALWPADRAAVRDGLRDAPTLYLDDIGTTRARREFTFTVRPAALALGKQDPNATTALVWRYWQERDRQWQGPAAAAVTIPAGTDADDPAVVGPVQGGQPGSGGIYFRIHEIGRGGLNEAAPPCHAVLGEGQCVAVKIERGGGLPIQMTYTPPAENGAANLYIQVPHDQRLLLEAWTACDASFLDNGTDPRFDGQVSCTRLPDRNIALFGAARLAIESLPLDDHLPTAEELWRGISVDEARAFHLEAPTPGEALAEKADFIGNLQSTWQTWRWDGGPVISYEDDLVGGLSPDKLEPPDTPYRIGNYVRFEQLMFENRRDGGVTAIVPRTAGTTTQLFALESPPNRGADYLRLRLDATSRYAALRPGSVGIRRRAALHSQDGRLSPWRGYTMGVHRSDPLPTPRISVAAPLFGRVEPDETTATTAGGFALYLDHPMFDPRHGGGLAERLEVLITVERVETGAPQPEAVQEIAALTVGTDPIRYGAVNPFEENTDTAPPVLWKRSQGGWDNGEPKELSLNVGTILGQTLEPGSPAPQFPFAIAFVEPAAGKHLLRPDTMAKIKVRMTAGGHFSDWSAPLWVHLLPDMAGTIGKSVAGEMIPVPVFRARMEDNSILLTENADAGSPATARFNRLYNLCADGAPTEPHDPYLFSKVMAVLIRTIVDVTGKPRQRVAAIVPGTQQPQQGIHFNVPDTRGISHLRLLEVQRVSGAGDLREEGNPLQATQRWFGGSFSTQPADDGPDHSVDINERVVGVGPLVIVTQ